MAILDLLFKLTFTIIVVGIALTALGVLLSYFNITDVVTIVGLSVIVIGLVLFTIGFVIFLWKEY